jgi:hypothetical protein
MRHLLFLLFSSLLLIRPAAAQEAPKVLFSARGDLGASSLSYDQIVDTYEVNAAPQASWSLTKNDGGESSHSAGSSWVSEDSAGVTIQLDSSVDYSDAYGPTWRGASSHGAVTIYFRQDDDPSTYQHFTVHMTDTFSSGAEGHASSGYGGPTGATTAESPSGSTSLTEESAGTCAVHFPDLYPGVVYCQMTAVSARSNALFVLGPHTGSGRSYASGTFTITVYEGTYVKPSPGGDECEERPDPKTGNVHSKHEDPITTRGYPLTLNVHVNSQSVEHDRAMGSASFTYDIYVTSEERLERDGTINMHRILVDGDGSRYDYGRIDNAPTPEPGVYGVLRSTSSGWELLQAGEPESIGCVRSSRRSSPLLKRCSNRPHIFRDIFLAPWAERRHWSLFSIFRDPPLPRYASMVIPPEEKVSCLRVPN